MTLRHKTRVSSERGGGGGGGGGGVLVPWVSSHALPRGCARVAPRCRGRGTNTPNHVSSAWSPGRRSHARPHSQWLDRGLRGVIFNRPFCPGLAKLFRVGVERVESGPGACRPPAHPRRPCPGRWLVRAKTQGEDDRGEDVEESTRGNRDHRNLRGVGSAVDVDVLRQRACCGSGGAPRVGQSANPPPAAAPSAAEPCVCPAVALPAALRLRGKQSPTAAAAVASQQSPHLRAVFRGAVTCVPVGGAGGCVACLGRVPSAPRG